MDPAASAVTGIRTIQGALKIIAALQLTAYLWPQHAHIQDGSTFDYIVVGAGSAGSLVAGRLSEDPNVNVLLIEAGGDPPLESNMPLTTIWGFQSAVDWNFTTESNEIYGQCHQNPYLHINNGKMIGGTGSFNFMLYTRGLPDDYNKWAEIVEDDTWSWENVLPHFKMVEKVSDPEYLASEHHGTEGALNIEQIRRNEGRYLKAYEERGYFIGNLNEGKTVGYSPMMLLISDGVRESSAHAYLSPAKDRKNLQLLKNTMVTKILFDEAKNAEGVEAMTSDGTLVTYKAQKEVIVSAGVFNTPKLLLLSGIGPKDHLDQHNIKVLSDLPVGQNLQDHISVTMPINVEKYESPPVHTPREYPTEAGYVGLAAFDKNSKLPDYMSYTYAMTSELFIALCPNYFQYSNEICNQIYNSSEDIESRIRALNHIMNLKPNSKGQVQLRSTNPEDPPLIETNFLSDNDDLERLVDYVEDFAEIVNTSYFRSVEAEVPSVGACKEFVEGSRDYWRCYSTCMMMSIQNYMGTARMGSVVDTRLRVYGVNRLRVADASVMPSLISGSTYAPVLMIAEKLVDFIKNDK